jgi:hypothetical protein
MNGAVHIGSSIVLDDDFLDPDGPGAAAVRRREACRGSPFHKFLRKFRIPLDMVCDPGIDLLSTLSVLLTAQFVVALPAVGRTPPPVGALVEIYCSCLVFVIGM